MKSRISPYLFILFIFLLAYFPIVSFLAGVKNDILTGYLPVRFFMSESISSGYMPWWNPYVNFGIPQYADMSSSFWSPLTWLIASTTGYNVYTITIELLLYVLLAGWGMYKCGENFGWNKTVRVSAAIAFMCSGFITGHLQHLNWIAGAAFLPWCYWSYENLLAGKPRNYLFLSVLFFYLLISSSHPGIIIGSIYFFFIITLYRLYLKLNVSKNAFFSSVNRLLWFVVLLVFASMALIYSYYEILPYITRGNQLFTATSKQNSTNFSNWISFVFPLTTVNSNHIFENDPSLRNCYFGIIPLLFFSLALLKSWRKNLVYILAGFFFLFISADNLFQAFVYKYLPLFGYVRLNGEFRLFAIFCFIILAGNSFSGYIKESIVSKNFHLLIKTLLFITISLLLWSLGEIVLKKRFAFEANDFFTANTIKRFLISLKFSHLLLFQTIFTSVILFAFYKFLRLKNYRVIVALVAIDLLFSTFMQLPFTGAGTKSTKELQSLLNASPKGILMPQLHPIVLNDTGIAHIDKILGNWSLYNKQPGNVSQAAYPIVFKTETEIYKPANMILLKQKSFISFEPSQLSSSLRRLNTKPLATISIEKYKPDKITLQLATSTPGSLFILYKQYKHWQLKINGENVDADDANQLFYKFKINNTGEQQLQFRFDTSAVKVVAIITMLTLLITVILLFISPQKFSTKSKKN